jgi:hypothetical protein
VLFKPEFDAVFQVGATCTFSAVSALSAKGDEGEGSGSPCNPEPEFNSIFQVGVFRANNSVSSLSLRERVRVRAVGNFKF